MHLLSGGSVNSQLSTSMLSNDPLLSFQTNRLATIAADYHCRRSDPL